MRVGAVTHRGYGQLVLQRFGPVWGGSAPATCSSPTWSRSIASSWRSASGWPSSTSGPASRPCSGWCWCCSRSAAAATGAGSGSCSGWPCSTACSSSPRSLVKPRLDGIGGFGDHVLAVPRRESQTVLLLIASTIGATVTPWMVFFQQSASADKGLTPHDIKHGRLDTIDRRRRSPRSSAAGRSSPAPRSRPRRRQRPRTGRAGFPAHWRTCRGGAGGDGVRARPDRGRRRRDPDDLRQHRLRRRRVPRRRSTASTHRAGRRAVLRRPTSPSRWSRQR